MARRGDPYRARLRGAIWLGVLALIVLLPGFDSTPPAPAAQATTTR